MHNYPIGIAGQPWNETHKKQWLDVQKVKRSYAQEVLSRIEDDVVGFVKVKYGSLPFDAMRYPLYAFKSSKWDDSKPTILVSGGVHGYETSGVQGAIDFLLEHATDYNEKFNVVIVPCISPWGYETINRWNPEAIDPNRSFHSNSPSPEAALFIEFIEALDVPFLAHFDLHETTDTDDTEFRPALAARDGLEFKDWGIPDGFYTVADTEKPQLAFQRAIIASVEKVTHIAPADAQGKIIGEEVVADGVICYDKKSLNLCAGVTNAKYVTTTEVYPDSPNTNAENCRKAQVAALCGGFDYLLKAC